MEDPSSRCQQGAKCPLPTPRETIGSAAINSLFNSRPIERYASHGDMPCDFIVKGCSSIGRAPVSKTGGCGFDSCRPCLRDFWEGRIDLSGPQCEPRVADFTLPAVTPFFRFLNQSNCCGFHGICSRRFAQPVLGERAICKLSLQAQARAYCSPAYRVGNLVRMLAGRLAVVTSHGCLGHAFLGGCGSDVLEYIPILGAIDLGRGSHVVCVSLGKLAEIRGLFNRRGSGDEQGFVADQN